MENKEIMEVVNEEAIQAGVSNSKGGLITKIVVGALGVAAGVGTYLFIRNKKKQALEAENVEADMTENNDENQ